MASEFGKLGLWQAPRVPLPASCPQPGDILPIAPSGRPGRGRREPRGLGPTEHGMLPRTWGPQTARARGQGPGEGLGLTRARTLRGKWMGKGSTGSPRPTRGAWVRVWLGPLRPRGGAGEGTCRRVASLCLSLSVLDAPGNGYRRETAVGSRSGPGRHGARAWPPAPGSPCGRRRRGHRRSWSSMRPSASQRPRRCER